MNETIPIKHDKSEGRKEKSNRTSIDNKLTEFIHFTEDKYQPRYSGFICVRRQQTRRSKSKRE
jgi:hypothetical protein